jgi:hypothetical protein
MTRKEIKALSKLKKSLDKIEKKLISLSRDIIVSTDTTNAYWSSLSRQAKKLYNDARITYAKWSSMNLPAFYDNAIRNQIRDIKSLSFIPRDSKGKPINVNYYKFINNNANTAIKTSVVKDSIMYFSTGIDQGERQLNRLMNLTQQLNLTDKELKKSLDIGLREKNTVYGASKQLQKDLSKKAVNGQLIRLVDKNGNPRNYTIEYYADMVARTEIINSNSQAVISTALEYQSDLIQVSSHNTTTPICQQYEGKIFSLSGKDPNFPVADNVPAYHPNCQHSISVVFREVLERRGIDKYIDFSQGKTEIHPTRKSHIPISKRA